MLTTLASIPSPPRNTIGIGPVELHIYGIMIGIGVLFGILVARRRYEKYGGNPDLVDTVGLWAVVAGVVGARLAHVSTNLGTYIDDPLRVFAVWRGGLALYGGLFLGAIVGVILMRRHGGDVPRFLDACAIGIPIAQIFGRFGNYANQELYGYPTDLPWALEIDAGNRRPGFEEFETFHPTFMYEQLWNLFIVIGVLLLIEKRWPRFAPGNLLVGYFGLYSVGRFITEQFRIDTEFRLMGLSRNAWASLVIAIAAGVIFFVRERRHREAMPVVEPPPSPNADDEIADA
jgi:prolipoprotein diacylglyceryl transferase